MTCSFPDTCHSKSVRCLLSSTWVRVFCFGDLVWVVAVTTKFWISICRICFGMNSASEGIPWGAQLKLAEKWQSQTPDMEKLQAHEINLKSTTSLSVVTEFRVITEV